MGKKLSIEEMQKLALIKNGKCLSKKYINTTTKLKWECQKGHRWEATPFSIKNGYWCPQCALNLRKGTIEEMQKLALIKNGKCLSDKYINSYTKLKWECQKGHRWEATPNSIKSGSWCPQCANENRKNTIEKMWKFAKLKDGKCLSKKYINAKTKLKWECKKEHRWEATPDKIKQGSWCPECAIERKRNTIEEMWKFAELKDGKCLSDKYINGDTKLKWECQKGHRWKAIPNSIKQGSWCPECAIARKRNTIEEMKKIGEDRNGKCLSDKYINGDTKLKWECQKGHRWEAIPNSIKQGSWCPECAIENQRKSIEEMWKIGEEREGKCLSDKYINNKTKLKWRCRKNHIWEATPHDIKRGTWCPICNRKWDRIILEYLQQTAEKRGGKCLSNFNEINKNTRMEWECQKGHRWEATPLGIIIGWWCPECRKDLEGLIIKDQMVHRTIDDMKFLADWWFGGDCLSKKYINSITKLKWRCRKNHIWEATPSAIYNDSWCPECAIERKRNKIEEMQKIGDERGGKCLSDKYINGDTKLKWECQKGHRWEAIPRSIKSGSWCPECAIENRKKTIEEMQKIGEDRGGKCLSDKYINGDTKLKWECQKGHRWEATPNNIQSGSWCPECAIERKRNTIEEMWKIGEERRGKCLSDKYINNKTKLKWECQKGHRWEATPSDIKQGTWCPICRKKWNVTS